MTTLAIIFAILGAFVLGYRLALRITATSLLQTQQALECQLHERELKYNKMAVAFALLKQKQINHLKIAIYNDKESITDPIYFHVCLDEPPSSTCSKV